MAQQTKIRIQAAIELIMSGHSYSEVVQKLSQSYKVTERTAKNYIKKGFSQIKQNYQNQTENLISTNYNRLLNIYKQALKEKDYSNAIKSINLMNRLSGSYNPENRDSNTIETVDFDFVEI